MKTAFKIWLVQFVIASTALAQAPFLKSFGGSGSDYGKAVVECSAGGYLIVGSTNSFYDVSTDIYVLRLTAEGEYIWGRNLGAANQIEWGHDVKEAADGGFYICGITNNNASNNYDGLLIKIDADGNEVWSKTYGGTEWDFIENMAITEDDEILLAGQVSQNDSQDGWLLKTDSEGEILWEQTFEGTGMVKLTGVDVCNNGDIVIVGYNDYTPLNTQTQISGVVQPDGNINWVSAFPEMGNLITKNCVCGISNKIISTGTAQRAEINQIKFSGIDNMNGALAWSDSINWTMTGEAGGINQQSDGKILLTGSLIVGFDLSAFDGVVYKREQDGSYIPSGFSDIFGGFGLDKFHCIIPTNDNGYTAVGQTNSFGNNNQIMLAHLLENGDAVVENEDFLDVATPVLNPDNRLEIKLWPNPAVNFLTLEISSDSPSLLHCEIITMTGQVVISQRLNKKGGNATIDIATLQNGVYFLTAFDSKGIRYRQRFVKVQ